jgi:stage V sporulation protein AF
MSLATRLARIFLLISTALFQTYGFVVATLLLILYLARMKSFGIPYLWPFLPFNYRAFRDVLLRAPMPLKNRRPSILHPKDPDR